MLFRQFMLLHVLAEDLCFGCETAAAVAAVQRQPHDVARHCRELGRFLLASEYVGSDTVNPALIPLPASVRNLADSAMAMPPLVRSVQHPQLCIES